MSAPNSIKGAGTLRLHYFLRIPNIGDRINPLLVSKATGLPTRFTADGSSAHLLAAGSLMAAATPHSVVWGTGVMHPNYGLGQPRKDNIYAVRGKLSLEALWQAGLATRDLPLGDPGLLAPRLLGIHASLTPPYKVGVVPHYVDRGNPYITRLQEIPDVCILDVRQDPLDFLRTLSKCQTVASSSLHGLIFAEALGLPTIWFKASDEIAGADFKFADWFSTTNNPQHRPHIMQGNETADSLAEMTELRHSQVSTDELLNAFPHERVEKMLDSTSPVHLLRPAQRARPALPVFIISFNRGQLLKRCLHGLQHLNRPTEPIIHDNGSTDPATLRILAELEREGIKVYRKNMISAADDLNLVDDTVTDFFSRWREPTRYAVTDCDVDLSVADPNVLEVYDELLDLFRKTECVGPMLRIRDINPSYSLYNHVLNKHIEQFWHKPPSWIETACGRVAIQECYIDTTFALHRAGESFRRLKPGVRVYEPYEALHLDWYEDHRLLDKAYHDTSHAEISHWNNNVEFELRKSAQLRFDQFVAVQRSSGGNLEQVVLHLSEGGFSPR